jgi:hypothetical protein
LLADGRVIADGSASELLAGGWYFATETARILGGEGGALLPEQGAELLRERTAGFTVPAGGPAPSGVAGEAVRATEAGDPLPPAATIAPEVAR